MTTFSYSNVSTIIAGTSGHDYIYAGAGDLAITGNGTAHVAAAFAATSADVFAAAANTLSAADFNIL